MQPPFVMDKWVTGLQENQRVDYTVNYEVGHFSSCSLKMHHTGSHAQSCLTTYIKYHYFHFRMMSSLPSQPDTAAR